MLEDSFTDLQNLSESITELEIKNKKIAAQNRSQNELLRATLEAIPSTILYLNKNLKIIWANPAAAASVSMTPEGLVGQTCYMAMGWGDECKWCPAKVAMEYGHSHSQDIARGERTFEVSAEPVRDKGNSGVIVVARDISHRKRNSDMVRRLYLRAQALCNASEEGIVIYRGGEVLIVNRAFTDLVGYSEVELQSDANLPDEERLMWQIIVPKYRDDVRKRIKDKDFSPYKVEYITKAGDRILVYVQLGQVEYNGDGFCRVARITPWRERHV